MIYFYVLLLRIVAFLEGPQKIVAFLVVFVMMSYSTLKRIPTKKLIKISKYNYYAILLCLAIFLHGLIFGNVLLRDVAVLLTYWIWFIFTLTYFKNKKIEECLKYVMIAFLIFNFTNFTIFELYFSNAKPGINSIMSLFGVHGYRVYFPLSSGANIYTSQLALNSIIILYFFKKSKNNYLYVVLYLFYIYMLVLADSRLILMFSLIFSFIYWFSMNTILTFFKKFWWAIGIALFGFLYIFYGTNIFDSFKRSGELSGRTLSRVEIWSLAKDVIFSDFHIITGYGLNGFENNMLESTKGIFESQYLQTSHNFLIQNIIDFGIVGIVIILYLIFEILKKMRKLKAQIITNLIVMLLFMGITESIPSFYSFEPTLFFIVILTIILSQNEREIS
ncbi:O-antigen polymerase [Polaribacter sp.]|uniref:O-antigen ligase family protein n=1 Tax=Polaribacter sp. TaxID=1920175 RepID=UPI0025EECB50|nr:O-antigen polymerase [Polaribacter sp.]